MLRGAEKLTFAANNRYHFILRFCKTKKNAHRMARSAG